jgi:hypothetical protein
MFNHAPAIIRWRDQLDELGLDIEDQPAPTISTMLFGCNQWLEINVDQTTDEFPRITTIKSELERWLRLKGLAFNG